MNKPPNVVLGTATASATITDDDLLTAEVTPDAHTVIEGSPATYTVTLSGGVGSRPVAVDYTVSGTATAEADYTAPSGKLTIPARQTTATITIPTLADDVLEPGEDLIVRLTDATTPAGSAMVTSTAADAEATTIGDHGGTVTVSVADTTVDEGESAQFTVTLSGTVSQDVTLNVATQIGSATALDYTAAANDAMATITAGETTTTISVATTRDDLAEEDETFRVTLTLPASPPPGVALGRATATATIADDDALTVTLTGPESVPADVDAAFTVTVTGGTSSADVMVNYDYRVGGTTTIDALTIDAGQSTGTITIGNDELEKGQTLVVRLTGVATDGTVTLGTPRQKSTAIRSDATETVSVAGPSAVDEGDPAAFTVSLSASVTDTVTAHYRTEAGSATTADYTSASGTVEIAANGTTATITVATLQDDLAEPSETFTVRLTRVDSDSAVALGTATATATIRASDLLTASVAGKASAVLEGAPASFTFSLAGGIPSAPVAIDYTVTGTATAGEDYTPPSGKLTIPAGQTTGTITIPTLSDEVLEETETLVVTLTGATTAKGTVNWSTVPATTNILQVGPPVTVSVADTTVDEAEAARITVTLSGEVSQDVTVAYVTADGTAEAPDDYTAAAPADGLTIPIPAGETTATFTVATIHDTLAEDSETFTVTLTLPADPAPVVSLADDEATVTITDDALTVTVAGPETVAEGEAARFTVTLMGSGGDDEVVVNYVVNDPAAGAAAGAAPGTATAGEDYTAPGGVLTIAAGAMTGTITIQTINEPDVVDPGETLVVTLKDAATSDGDTVRVGVPATATTTIEDRGTVTVAVEADQETVVEGEPATFTVTLSGTVSVPVTLGYQTNAGTARAGTDYTAADAEVVIPAGAATATITVATKDDDATENPVERFSVTLKDVGKLPPGVTLPPATATAHAQITDYALLAGVTGEAMVDEGSPATFTVTLTGGANRTGVTVEYQVGGTATAADYTAPRGTLAIPAGAPTGTITISTRADDVLDDGETLVVTLTSATATEGVARLGEAAAITATTSITDGGMVTVSVAADAATVDEGQPASFTVTLSGTVSVPVTVGYATADGSATAGADYRAAASGARVVIPAGQTERTITVATVEDTLGEADETFAVTLTLRNPPSGVSLDPAAATATVTIMDDDITLVVTAADVTVPEGAAATITVTLSEAFTSDVRVEYATEDGSAKAGADYTAPAAAAAVVIPAGQTTATFEVATLDDALAEAAETFMVTLRESGPVTARAGTVTITDDDALTVSVAGPATVAEGAAAEYTVTLAGGAGSEPVAVAYTVRGTATKDEDYTAPSGTVTIAARKKTATFAIETKTDRVVEPDETLVVTLTGATTTAGSVSVGTPATVTTTIADPVTESVNRVNQALLPGVARAAAASALDAVSSRMAQAAAGAPPAATANVAGLTSLYGVLQANERALQDGAYDLARALAGSSFLVPLSSHDGAAGAVGGFAVWGSGDYRHVRGGDADAADDVDWDGAVWSARLGADLRFVDSLLTGLAVSWSSGALDYVDGTPDPDLKGAYGSRLLSVHPYVGWTTPGFGLWATGGIGWGEVKIDDDAEWAAPQTSKLTQWSVAGGASATLLSTDDFIAGGTTAVKLKGEGLFASAAVKESEGKIIAPLTVNVSLLRATLAASHAQRLAAGVTLAPSLELGGRYDGGDGATGAGFEVGGGLRFADPGTGLTAAGRGRVLIIHGGNYGEWGLSGLLQFAPDAAGRGLSLSVRPAWGAPASGVDGLWEQGARDLLAGGQAGGRVAAEIAYGLAAFGATGVLTPYAGASLTDAGARSLSLGGRLQVGPAFELSLEAERRERAAADPAREHDLTLEGTIHW